MSDRNRHAVRFDEHELLHLLADSGYANPDFTPHMMELYLRRGRKLRAQAAHDLTRRLVRAVSQAWRQLFATAPQVQTCGKS